MALNGSTKDDSIDIIMCTKLLVSLILLTLACHSIFVIDSAISCSFDESKLFL